MEQCSLPHSQVPVTCPCSNPARSSTYPHILFLWGTCPIQSPNLPHTKSHAPFSLLRSYQSISPGPRLTVWMCRNKIRFYGEELLAPCPSPKLEDHPLLAVCDCLFNMFAATYHIGGRSLIRNLRMPHAVVTGTYLSVFRNMFALFNVFLPVHHSMSV
jgi:hypothetical protein